MIGTKLQPTKQTMQYALCGNCKKKNCQQCVVYDLAERLVHGETLLKRLRVKMGVQNG